MLGEVEDVSDGDLSPPDVVDVEAAVELCEVGSQRSVSVEFVDQLAELLDSPRASL